MASFSIFGQGNMGHAIGGLVGAGGSSVQYVAHSENLATLTGEIVVLAVPYPAVDAIVAQYGNQLAGKVVVDITNPLNFETFDSLVVPAGSSATAEIQAKLPQSKVVKAFNTNFAATLVSKLVAGAEPTTVLIAGDDADAKASLAAAIEAGGISAVDAGSLARAHELEALGFLELTLAVGEKIGWTGGLALLK